MSALDPASPVPLYHQLADLLEARICSGEYPLGARIPSEPDLARTFGIGRPTVRQATDQLIQKRRLERRRGSGTFVTEPPEQVDLFTLAGTMASFRKRGIAVRSHLVQRPRRVRAPDDAENPFAGREATFFSRLSQVREEPVLLEEIYLDPEHFPGLARMPLAGRSLAELVKERFGLVPESADQNFRVEKAGAVRGELLGLAKDSDILVVKRNLHFPVGDSAIFAELYCRTDQLVFSQTLRAMA